MRSQRTILAAALLSALAGCGGSVIVAPGHRGLLFDPRRGLQHEVLGPGSYRLAGTSRVDDYDVTYSTRKESMTVMSAEGLTVDVRLAVIYRPVVSELYELDSEIGANYYDEVVGPELRSAARAEFAQRPLSQLMKSAMSLEGSIEVEARRRIQGKHVELAGVTVEAMSFAPELAAAIRARETAAEVALKEKIQLEQAAAREKLASEEKWAKEKLELERDVVRRRLLREAAGTPAPGAR